MHSSQRTQQPNNHFFGAPAITDNTRILLLGSGELGREITIELMRLGAWVCAVDSYDNAPAQQIAHESRTIEMENPEELRKLIDNIKPDIIIPEIEAIATQELQYAHEQGIQIVPSVEIATICMNREALRRLAGETLHLQTSPYRFADSLEELEKGVEAVGMPCVVKPIMSSSGHGQSVIRNKADIANAWNIAQTERRSAHDGTVSRVIVEGFVDIAHELTILTVSSSAGIITCPPIGQRQEHGDYQESWQPAQLPKEDYATACTLATTIVQGLVDIAHEHGETGWGVYGVELFVLSDGKILFNEVSPRPHDTGMVTLYSQRLSEFALHARAVLGIPIHESDVALHNDTTLYASRAIGVEGNGVLGFSALPSALAQEHTDMRIFSKPNIHGKRRMAVALASGKSIEEARERTNLVVQTLQTTIFKGEE